MKFFTNMFNPDLNSNNFSLVVSMPRPQTESANFDLKNIQIKKSNENLVQKQVQKDQKIKTKTISLQKTFDSQILKHHQILNTTAQPAQTPSRFYARLTNSQPLLNGRKA
jgi:hypothetical protein